MIVRIQDLKKDYGATQALKGISLEINDGGAIVGILGPNGSGKTTLLETLEGMRTPTSGTVSVLGLDPTRRPQELRERLGVQLQSTALPRDLTALETLRLFAAFYRKSVAPAELLERVGLTDRAHSRNSALSGGQLRRLAIAVALVNDPELAILDEPTSGLDPVARREIHERIKALRASHRTVLLSTHYLEEAEQLCDRVIILRAGEVVADGSPLELVSHARGESQVLIKTAGTLDPAPLVAVGARYEGLHDGYHRFSTPDPPLLLVSLGRLTESGLVLEDMRVQRPNLESLYLDLVGADAVVPEEAS